MDNRKIRNGDSLPVPYALGIEDGYLVSDQTAPTYARVRPTMLDDFLMIRTDDDILNFARKFGTLGLCKEHATPGCNERLRGGELCWPEQVRSYSGPLSKGPVWREPLWAWHRVVARANVLRRIGARIQSGAAGSKSDWEIIIIPEDRSAEKRSGLLSKIMSDTGVDHLGQPWRSARSAQHRFSWIMQSWLALGNVRPSFDWDRDRWAIRSSVPSRAWPLFGYLALHLAVAIAGGMQSAICSFCAREYFPLRRPTSGQRNCCGDASCKRDYWRENKRIKAVRPGSQR
jgi:hypothetical protein